MNIGKAKLGIEITDQAQLRNAIEAGLELSTVYHVQHHRAGKLLWEGTAKNLVTTEGLTDVLAKYFKGASYTAAWFMGLVNNAGFTAFVAGDTAAQIGGSNGWAESTAYSESVRQTVTLGTPAAGSVSNSASKCVFTANGTVSIKGMFMASASAKSATTGVLYGEVALSIVRAMISADTLTIQVTLTAASA